MRQPIDHASREDSVADAAKHEHGMLAGEVAKSLGLGVQTLHFYEREGLIAAPPRSHAGYRLYTPELVERVRFIRKAQALGLSLEEIREILQLAEIGTSPCGRVQRALEDKLREVDRRLRELRGFRRDLAALIAHGAEVGAIEGRSSVCAIVEGASSTERVANRIALPLRARQGVKRARRGQSR